MCNKKYSCLKYLNLCDTDWATDNQFINVLVDICKNCGDRTPQVPLMAG